MDLIQLLDRPIAFHRCFVGVAGTVNGGVFLSQAVYWTNRLEDDREGWFYKSIEQWSEETGLTKRQQQVVRSELKNLGVLEEKQRGGTDRRVWFKINIDRLKTVLIDLESGLTPSHIYDPSNAHSKPMHGLDMCVPTARSVPCITETTSETTSEITSNSRRSASSPSAPDATASPPLTSALSDSATVSSQIDQTESDHAGPAPPPRVDTKAPEIADDCNGSAFSKKEAALKNGVDKPRGWRQPDEFEEACSGEELPEEEVVTTPRRESARPKDLEAYHRDRVYLVLRLQRGSVPSPTKKELGQWKSLLSRCGSDPQRVREVIDLAVEDWGFWKQEWKHQGAFPCVGTLLNKINILLPEVSKRKNKTEIKPIATL